MDYITTTGLRTQTSSLIKKLAQGKTVKLVHRSKVLGDIRPKRNTHEKPVNLKAFIAAVDALGDRFRHIPKDPKKRDAIYRKRLEEKYGRSIS